MQTQFRYWEYYGMTKLFDNLYEESKNGKSFNKLFNSIISKENILLAYRTIKTNKGSRTPGVDGRTINDFKSFNENELVSFIQKRLINYRPMKVRRVMIPKANGKLRPLGIPSMSDRIIQQAFKQILEPICEAKFYKHSYGFRPLRSTQHAIARVNHLINNNFLHYVVDVDIKGFFDNVNHTLLIKQLWNIGIRDKKVLSIISKMLKAEIEGIGVPSKGTPQGGILSPLLSNVVLNDLDQWIASQWEDFDTNHKYAASNKKIRALKTTNLKEGYIVRYADDFKIFCRDWATAQKWYHATRLYLKERLKLDISPEKSKVVNLKKRRSEFLGYAFKARIKGKKRVSHSYLAKDKIEKYIKEGKKRIQAIKSGNYVKNALLFNSWVLGIHNYSRGASHCSVDFQKIHAILRKTLHIKLKKIAKYEVPTKPPPIYSKMYSTTSKTYKIGHIYLYPVGNIRHSSLMNFSPKVTPFIKEYREAIQKSLKSNIVNEIAKLTISNIPDSSIEFFDNRISRYSMKLGKCEITGEFLPAEMVNCHHYVPRNLGGTDDFSNLRIINKFVHILIHATETHIIENYKKLLNLNKTQLKKINEYRSKCNLESIN